MMLSHFLKVNTADIHKKTESTFKRINLMSSNFSVMDYKNLLTVQLVWHDVLEAHLSRQNIGYQYQNKAKLIENDLHQLSVLNTPFPEVKLPESLHPVGLIYVLEGSMLGGMFILKFLLNQNIPEDALTFYQYCKSSGAKSWKAGQAFIDQPEFLAEQEAILKSATYAFELMDEVMNLVLEKQELKG
ncbi:MAG: biliverdin-producing heme oxygenase [Cyclobacteriaceae bacterium]